MSIKPFDDDIKRLDDDNIRPSTRLTERRSGIVSAPPIQKRKSIALCIDCYSSIYDDNNYYTCYKCNSSTCYNCLQYNKLCANCHSKIYKDHNNIPIKYTNRWSCCKIFTKCLFCLPNNSNV